MYIHIYSQIEGGYALSDADYETALLGPAGPDLVDDEISDHSETEPETWISPYKAPRDPYAVEFPNSDG